MDQITVESVDKQIAELQEQHGHKIITDNTKAFDPAAILKSMCAAVKIATPILNLLIFLLAVKPNWKKVLQAILDASKLACPDNGN